MPKGPQGQKRPADVIGNAVQGRKQKARKRARTAEQTRDREANRDRSPEMAKRSGKPKHPASGPTAQAERTKYHDFYVNLARKYERMRRSRGGSDA